MSHIYITFKTKHTPCLFRPNMCTLKDTCLVFVTLRPPAPSSITVYLGRQSQQGINSNEVSRTLSQIIVHPSYNSGTSDNDIALLRLSSAVSFTAYITPVCLAATDSTFYSGVDTWVTGWGTIGSGG